MVNKISLEYLDAFNKLGFQVNSNFSNLYNLSKIIESQYDYVYGYYLDDKLVGFIHVTKLYETMDIVNVVVDREVRKQGIATKLINYVIDLFDDIDNVMLEVNENNIPAISLYKKNNFEIINKRNNYYGSDAALIMKRVVENERC
ncbi:MAG: GNAT family N-acetyltransferase [Firmicutes bacterium]|nr:GNAT family N-acetyltransferase [Bacillota bacterium]